MLQKLKYLHIYMKCFSCGYFILTIYGELKNKGVKLNFCQSVYKEIGWTWGFSDVREFNEKRSLISTNFGRINFWVKVSKSCSKPQGLEP